MTAACGGSSPSRFAARTDGVPGVAALRRPRRLRAIAAAGLAGLAQPVAADAQSPTALTISGPSVRATGVAIGLTGRGAPPGAAVDLQRLRPSGWITLKATSADDTGRVAVSYRPQQLSRRYRLRLATAGATSPAITVRSRDVTLAAFGDVNFGDGVRTVMEQRGARWPWRGVAPTLRRADVAFGNLECAISNRGSPVPKQFNFRGSPSALRQVVRFAGLDVLNLANNHAGDYGTLALLDTVRAVRRAGAIPVGAGADIAAAHRPQVISRLGLRIAFVGFSDIGPTSFAAGPGRPGTAFASDAAIRTGVRAARRRSDVVVATFQWGIERDQNENARQRAFAQAALRAGATAVIGAHPHVLQPIRRPSRRRLIAYSLGNFVWAAGSPATSATGILRLALSRRGVEGSRLLRARIVGTQPRLVG